MKRREFFDSCSTWSADKATQPLIASLGTENIWSISSAPPFELYQFIPPQSWRTDKVYQFIHTEKSVAKTWLPDKVYQFIYIEKSVAKAWRTEKVYQFIHTEKSVAKTWLPDKVYQFIYTEKPVAKTWHTDKVYQFIHTEKSVAKTWHTDKVYQFIHTEKPVAKTWLPDKVYQFIYIEKSVASHKSLQLKSGVLRNFVCLFCFCFVFICPFHIICYSKMPQWHWQVYAPICTVAYNTGSLCT